MHRTLVLLSALVLAVLAMASPHPAIAEPAGEARESTLPADRAGLKGMAGHWWHVDRFGSGFVDQYARLGVTNVRLAVDWSAIEPAEGQLDFTRLDPVMAAFRQRRIEVVPVVASVPLWAALNPDECGQQNVTCLLNRDKLDDFRETMGQLVGRYPEARRWEFWNEPEMWYALRDPADYEIWYRAFYQAAREANPAARIAVGTLGGWDFFGRLPADLPIDAVSIHSYAGHQGDPLQTDRITRLHDGLESRGQSIPIWLTEYGWDSRWLPDNERAELIRWVFRWLLDHPYIELAHYHMLHDDDQGGCCFGIVGAAPDFAPKQPAYDVFRSYTVAR